ncbi:CRISPR-associated endonuclease Cas9 [Streptococcus mutans UA159] [Rhizoctonia solani]|uniref:CRISPR-associated endonuclease Cas9 [Streptococcus mutans UA159] n=1 Tax=Rhizoctonia solani TaxID=456999 RepID=A0A0K6GF30_9AGAM|nr:CRISPR-associated endonuclease Cas9 [Streptococcus mutans UA159] [Rhizoctonia solani]
MLGQYRATHDILPEAPLAPESSESASSGLLDTSSHPALPSLGVQRLILRFKQRPETYTTPMDSFGQYRVYAQKPLTIPDSAYELKDISDVQCSRSSSEPIDTPEQQLVSDIIYPCPNISAFRLQHWHWCQGVKKSKSARQSLVSDVITKPDFIPSDVANVNWTRLDEFLAADVSSSRHSNSLASGWRNISIDLCIPPRTTTAAALYKSNPQLNTYSIPEVPLRSLTQIVRLAFTKNNTSHFHYEPFESFRKDPLTAKIQQCYGEAYESKRMRDMHQAIQDTLLDKPCSLPRCIAALMIFSDATQLASFGPAKAWPIRLTFGNYSKYERCKPNSGTNFEVGYIPNLPPNIQDKIRNLEPGKPVPRALLTQIRRELIHAVWSILLDDEFLQSWRHGIIIMCADGIERRVFPRIFSYSADYMEKILLATIRGMKSLFPCPRCLTPKCEFHKLGLPEDQARREQLKRVDNRSRSDVHQARSFIYDKGRAVNSQDVENLLKSESYTPVDNAFSRHLRPLGFDIFESLTVDFMHEFELGVWKAVFTHIIRILEAIGSKGVTDFNLRFRMVPAFGNGTIRGFQEDVTNMTRPTASDYEGVLQCILPVLEGLLPAIYERQILNLVFVLAQWHALGHELRSFKAYTSQTKVYETQQKLAVRQRRIEAKKKTKTTTHEPTYASDPKQSLHAQTVAVLTRTQKFFSLDTSKIHVLGDHPESIETFGTTDSTSTQVGEFMHRPTKQRFSRTNNQSDYLLQMNKIEKIENRLIDIKSTLDKASEIPVTGFSTLPSCAPDNEENPVLDFGRSGYHIATSQKNPIVLPTWLHHQQNDPAFKGFNLRLKNHLLARILGGRYQNEANHSDSALAQIRIQHDRIYSHQTLKINYTTYDIRRAQDLINPNTYKRFIIVPSEEDSHNNSEINSNTHQHPFWYARVLGVYHANVLYQNKPATRMDFLWVRWLGRVMDAPGSWERCHLDEVGYWADNEEAHAFEFIDPSDVIRAAHLIPKFTSARTHEFLGPESITSIALDDPLVGDWEYYYVNRFVDRDMFMRYFGPDIGRIIRTADIATLESAYEYFEMDNESHTGEQPCVDDGNSESEDDLFDYGDEDEYERGNTLQ